MDEADAAVFAVHTTRPDEGAGAVEVIFTDERSAQNYARSRSNDSRITSASVTSYTLGQLGSRRPITWYRDGREQDLRAARPDQRYYPTDHPCPALPDGLPDRCGP
ncbi:MAG: hypothetical protein ACRDRK_24890 [Pseudonocardia sp.]